MCFLSSVGDKLHLHFNTLFSIVFYSVQVSLPVSESAGNGTFDAVISSQQVSAGVAFTPFFCCCLFQPRLQTVWSVWPPHWPQWTTSPAVHVSVLMVDGQAGDLPLQLAKRRLLRQVGAQQQTTQHVSVEEQGGRSKRREVKAAFWRPSLLEVPLQFLYKLFISGSWLSKNKNPINIYSSMCCCQCQC